MKFLLVFAVLFIAIYIWRRNRRDEELQAKQQQPVRKQAAVGPPQDMARCAHCGLHLPAGDAVRAADGVYCSVAHQRAGPA
jgi:uncharacterized protein